MVTFQRRVPRVVGWMVAATLLVSIAAAVDGRGRGGLSEHLALIPADVWRGQLWRLVTWIFVQAAPLTLVFTCATMYWCGGDLADAWGEAALLRYAGGIVLAAAGGTTLIGLVHPGVHDTMYLGGWALTDALLVAWALRFPERRVRFLLVFPLGGRDLVAAVLGLTLLFALFYGPSWVLPELIAGGAALYATTGGPRGLAARLERLRRRRAVRGVPGGRPRGPYAPS